MFIKRTAFAFNVQDILYIYNVYYVPSFHPALGSKVLTERRVEN